MKRFSSLSKENSELAALSSQAGSGSIPQKIWESIAPAGMKSAAHAGNIKHKRLTIYANNGAVAAKIKLLLPSLLSQLQKQGLEVTSIRVQVQVQPGSPKKVKRIRSISPQAASRLSGLAHDLQGTALGEALTRLSSRTDKS